MGEVVKANIPNSADQNKSIRDAAMASINMHILTIAGANADYVAVPSAGRIKAFHAVTDLDPGAATLLTLSNLTKTRTVGTVVVANSSSAGDKVSNVDIAANVGQVANGDVLKILSNAAATAAAEVNITVEIDRSEN